MKDFLKKFRIRKIVLAIADVFIVGISALIANFLLSLFDMDASTTQQAIAIMIGTVCCVAGLLAFGAYNKMWRYFRSKDYLSCVYGVMAGMLVCWTLVYLIVGSNPSLHAHMGKHPVLYAFVHGVIALLGVCLFRFIFKRTFIELVDIGIKDASYKRTMIIGGGQACKTLLREIKNAQESPYTEDKRSAMFSPVCIIDDDRSKIGKEVSGVTVVGASHEIPKFVQEYKIEQILFAIPSCLEDERKRILEICSGTTVPVKMIPFIGNLIFDDTKTSLLHQVRDIKVEDLLGRDPIRFDNQEIKKFIHGKVCMVTGGGGSIGSELVRQIAKYDPKRIIIVDIYENNAYDVQQELKNDYGDELDLHVMIASVRDYFRMNQLFEKYKPQIVFHAAAHKHVPLMEDSPMEAIKNNVVGTFNVATLAQFHDAEKFVMISTDKAVNPTNVMGASKRCCEMIIQYLSQQHEGRTEFVTTRFGNVLGSNGSVIPLFKRQIEQGRPVTVTHRDVIRYFMTIPEAVSLVLEAAAIAQGGEIFVLDMGKPVRIVTLAENLIRMYGKAPYEEVPIVFTGLRPGEKIKEELLMDEEGLQKTSNKLIFIGKQIEIEEAEFIRKLRSLCKAAKENDEALAVKKLHEIVPTFVTPEEFNKLKEETKQQEESENKEPTTV